MVATPFLPAPSRHAPSFSPSKPSIFSIAICISRDVAMKPVSMFVAFTSTRMSSMALLDPFSMVSVPRNA